MRISSWARRNSRNGTLVNLKRWEQIQQLFPEKCQKRLRGEDDEDLFDIPPPKRTISQDGELRKEYEEELRKLQQAREQEMRASEEAIHKLQEEEERLVRSLEYQALQDEELARKIVSEEREQNSQEKARLSQPSTSGTSLIPPRAKTGKGKKNKPQATQASHGCSTLDRWFSPTRQSSSLDKRGLEQNRYNLDKNQSCLKSMGTDDSWFTSISDLINERKEQEDKDFQLALKLQREFDLASRKSAEVDRQKGTVDAYLLRSENQSETSESSSDKSS